MTNAEAKTAAFRRIPVVYNGIVYTHIKEIRCWFDDNDEYHISLVLVDKNKRSYTHARVEDVNPYDYKNQATPFMP